MPSEQRRAVERLLVILVTAGLLWALIIGGLLCSRGG